MPGAQLRSEVYLLLASLLREAPSGELLEQLKDRQQGWNIGLDEMERPLVELSQAAAESQLEALIHEYHRLFIGVTQGRLLPYESWYRVGSLHDRPLVELRDELVVLGIERTPGLGEPEDHIAAICEVMALLIEDHDPRQEEFFNRHLASWMSRFWGSPKGNHGTILPRRGNSIT